MSTLSFDHTEHATSATKFHAWSLFDTIFELPAVWARRAARRDELRELLIQEDRIFHDIGFSRLDVAREARKPFWRA
jgi:uncharacterized protein YjiS (DUF1127 family)